MKDLASKLSSALGFGPVTLAADQTAVEIDLQGYNSAVVLLGIGVGGITFDTDNKIDFTLRHKAASGDSYADVALDDLNGKDKPSAVGSGGIVKSLQAAHAAAALYEIGYVGGKRYIELDIEFTGTHGTGTPIFFAVIKGHPEVGPAS